MVDQDARHRPPVVTVSNLFGDLNVGGAAITARTMEAVLSMTEDVQAISVHSVDAARSHPVTRAAFPEVEILRAPLTPATGPLPGVRAVARSLLYLLNPRVRSLPRALQRVAASDVVVSKGGYVFVVRRGLRELMSMWSTVFPLVFARRVGVPTVTLTTSVSPSSRGPARWLTGWVLRGAALVVPRDPLSAEAALRLGVDPARIKEMPDIVLGSRPPGRGDIEALCARVGVQPERFAVIIARSEVSGAAAAEDLGHLVDVGRRLLARHEIDDILVVNQAGDVKASVEVAARIGGSARLIQDLKAPNDLMALYAGARILVSCRLHGAIFALVGGTPAVSVAVDPLKAEGVYASIGLPAGWVVQVGDADGLGSAVESALASDAPSRNDIQRSVGNVAEALKDLPTLLRQACSGSRTSRAGG